MSWKKSQAEFSHQPSSIKIKCKRTTGEKYYFDVSLLNYLLDMIVTLTWSIYSISGIHFSKDQKKFSLCRLFLQTATHISLCSHPLPTLTH